MRQVPVTPGEAMLVPTCLGDTHRPQYRLQGQQRYDIERALPNGGRLISATTNTCITVSVGPTVVVVERGTFVKVPECVRASAERFHHGRPIKAARTTCPSPGMLLSAALVVGLSKSM
ncbi:hypothetical protein MRX96_059665 [Rhipicephalus microplus]